MQEERQFYAWATVFALALLTWQFINAVLP